MLQPAYDNGPLAHELAAPFYARVKGQDEVTKKQYLDMNMWLPGDILLKADKMCMAHSLELRVPFLDKKGAGIRRNGTRGLPHPGHGHEDRDAPRGQ